MTSIEQKTMNVKKRIAEFKKKHIYLYQKSVIKGDPVAQQIENDVDSMTDEEYYARRNSEPKFKYTKR
jgi:hypothetical protein